MRNYYPLPEKVKSFFNLPNTVVLETTKFDQDNYETIIFSNPVAMIEAFSTTEIPGLFKQIEYYLAGGFYVAGYLNYECGYYFEKKFSPVQAIGVPIAWLGVYRELIIFNHLTGKFTINLGQAFPKTETPPRDDPMAHVSKTTLTFSHSKEVTEEELLAIYTAQIKRIKDYIWNGDVYQINYTGKYSFHLTKTPFGLYESLKRKQAVSYGAFMNTPYQSILSFSPELFFRINNRQITTKPMKGTVQRGRNLTEDLNLQKWLQQDEKNRAENLMIVDLIRNDLGRIAEIGSVKVPQLFEIEKYQTLWQMTSTITAKLRKKMSFFKIFEALFPCGSVTGAPKIRAMEIIRALEAEPRGVYTGTIGYITPRRNAVFNVAIRTIAVQGSSGEMGVGGGVVWDSEATKEYAECRLKGDFLTTPPQDFDVLESILWNQGYPFLEEHLQRLTEAATYFDYPVDIIKIKGSLYDFSTTFAKGAKYKVRLCLQKDGQVSLEKIAINVTNNKKADPLLIDFAAARVNPQNPFLYYKTTNRSLFNQLSQEAVARGLADLILLNDAEEVTEGATHNLFIRNGKEYLTPAVDCGLLNGIYRQHLMKKLPKVKEAQLSIRDLQKAEAIYLCNAIRGLRRVYLN